MDDEAPKKRKVGRPTLYKKTFAKQAEKLCKLGATDPDMADFFGVSLRTLADWKKAQPEFLHALKGGKLLADAEVADKLFRRATGYSHSAVKILSIAGQVEQVKYVEHYPPDTGACVFWLKNRRPDLWRDKVAEDGGDTGTPESRTFTFNVVDGRKDGNTDTPASGVLGAPA